MGHKTLRYQDGGIMFLRCLLDEEMELLLQGNINVRNTGLRPWTADNYDLSLEYYTSKGGLYSVGVFMKNITNFFGNSVRIATLADTEVLQVLAGGTVFLALIAVLSTAIGSLFRGTAPAMGAVLGLLLVAPGLLPIIPGIGGQLAGFLPSTAGMMLVQSAAQSGWQPILTGGLVLLGWTAAAVVLGGVRFTRRDV